MSKEIFLPVWLSVLSLAVALIVPFGVLLIADTSLDTGGRNIVRDGGRFIPPDTSPDSSMGQRNFTRLDHGV